MLGHLFERGLLAHDHDYSGWDLSLEDLRKLGVEHIQVVDDAAWLPQVARDDLDVYRIELGRLTDFTPRTQ